ncbi:MAG: cell division protein ZapA [Oscillospiraceae bacterium]|nr:cell division protein ZapA [Oscillospiraceae bacterium]
MNPTSRVKIEVCGARYNIASNEPEEYVKELGAQLNAQISDMLAQNNSLSVTDVLILCLLNYMDNYRKAEGNTDHMRNQLTGYLEDAAKYRIEADEAKREIERLRQEMKKMEQELADAKRMQA